MLWLAAIALLAAGALLPTEWWVRHRAVQEAADRIATAIQADVELQVVGRPLTWRLLRRHLHQVILVAEDLPVLEGTARLRRLRIELDDVRLEGPAQDRRITAGAGRFDLRLDGDQLLPMVTLPPFLLTFTIVPRGVRLMTLAGVAVDASLELAGSALKVRANRGVLRLIPHPTFWLPLPTWPYGAVVDDMLLHDGWLEAWGTLDPDTLVFPVTARGDAPRAADTA